MHSSTEPFFDFVLTLDRPRVFRVNESSRKLFRDLTDLEIGKLSESLRSRPIEERIGALVMLLFATGVEADRSLTFPEVARAVTVDVIYRLPFVFSKASRRALLVAGKN